MSKRNIAVVGCGHWGKNLIRNFSELGALHSVSDTNIKAMNNFASQYDVKALSIEEILKSDEVEGVVIAAPAPLHYNIASSVLSAGKHVFVEKPITLTKSDAQSLIEQAKTADRALMVGHLLNYHNGFLKVLELVQGGAVGNIQRIYSNRLSFGQIRSEENVLWSFAPHDISMILRLVGSEPTAISAQGSAHVNSEIEDFCHLQMSFEGNVSAHVFVAWLNPTKEQKLVVVGDGGMIVFDDTLETEKKVCIYKHSVDASESKVKLVKAEGEYVSIEPSEPLKAECSAFIGAITDPSSIYTDGAEGLRVLSVLSDAEEILQSNRSK